MKTRSISRLASCIIIAGCISHALLAQNQNGFQHSELQVLSPSAHEMGKYGKVPVSYFNGLPNISVPLTEVRAKGYTLPVYLTYYAGGNRPDQHPGWVGQGWSLHAGGSITRIIHGSKELSIWLCIELNICDLPSPALPTTIIKPPPIV